MQPTPTLENQTRRDLFVEELVSSWKILSPLAEAVQNPCELPPRLEQRVKALRKGYFWRAWEDDGRVRFVIMHLDELGGEPAVEAYFFDESARLVSAGSWSRLKPGHWHLTDRFEGAATRWRHSRLRPLVRAMLHGKPPVRPLSRVSRRTTPRS